MNRTPRYAIVLALLGAMTGAAPLAHAEDEEIVTLEPIKVEATFDLQLELRQRAREAQITERLRAESESRRVFELQNLNKSAISRLLELTKFSPIPLGGSENRIDTFFIQNHLRADLNPSRNEGVLFQAE